MMVCDSRWTYIGCESFRPVLFDLEADPQELNELGGSDASEHERICGEMLKVIADLADTTSHKDHRAEPEYENHRPALQQLVASGAHTQTSSRIVADPQSRVGSNLSRSQSPRMEIDSVVSTIAALGASMIQGADWM